MPVGVVTGFTYRGTEYKTPISRNQRESFARDLIEDLEALDGIASASVGGATASWDGITLEVELELTTRGQLTRLVPNLRKLSPRMRTLLRDFTPVSSFEVCQTPTPKDASRDLYESTHYSIDIWFY